MIIFCAVILYLIAAILGVWSASLLWRVWHASRLRRRAKRSPTPGVKVMTPRRGRLGIGAALLSLPLAGVAFSFGEYVRTGMSSDEFDLLPILIRGAGAMLLLLGIGAFYAAWRFDPALGRRRCGKCWYDMSATPGRKCPECGREATNENGLLRTRRAPGLVLIAAVFILTAYSMHLARRVYENGWVAAVPTTALIVGMPWLTDEMAFNSERSLWQRWYSESMWGWQQDLLQWRSARVLRESEDFDVIMRARTFAPYPATLNTRAVLKLLRNVCDPTGLAAGKVNQDPMFALELSELMPASLDEETAREANEILLDAMRSTDRSRRTAAVSWCPTIGEASGPLLQRLNEILRDKEEEEAIRCLVVYALGRTAGTSDEAWGAMRWASLEADSARMRLLAFRIMQTLEGRQEAALRLASEGVYDLDWRVAQQAAILRVQLSDVPCDEADVCIALMDRHPGACEDLLVVLATRCPDNRVYSAVERMLNSDSVVFRQAAALAAGKFGATGAALLPRLREISTDSGAGGHAESAKRSIHAIETAIHLKKSQSDD